MKSSMAELPDEQEMIIKQEIEGSVTPNPLPASLWRRLWRASFTAVAYLLLYTFSQVTVSLQTLYTMLLFFLSDILPKSINNSINSRRGLKIILFIKLYGYLSILENN